MKKQFSKLEKNSFQGMNSVKGGIQLAAKSVTTTTATIERGNDLDSARHIESKTTVEFIVP